jgi:hypothetical protein
MTTHFAKFSGIKANLTKSLTKNYMERMIVRQHVDKTKNLHPNVKARWNQMTQMPLPFTYQLHSDDLVKDDKGNFRHLNEPLGPLEDLPF